MALALMTLGLSGCGGTATPTGTYTTKIAENGNPYGKLLSGTWTLAFGKNGSYSISQGPELGIGVGRGSYVRGDSFVIKTALANTCGPGPGTGEYKIKLSGNTLRLQRIRDPCKVRSIVLAQTFRKAR